eukprot:13659910-Alexandrium_andersonii.AAC.1
MAANHFAATRGISRSSAGSHASAPGALGAQRRNAAKTCCAVRGGHPRLAHAVNGAQTRSERPPPPHMA